MQNNHGQIFTADSTKQNMHPYMMVHAMEHSLAYTIKKHAALEVDITSDLWLAEVNK